MTWFGWFLLAFFALNALVVVAMVGKPRTPIEPSTAVGVIVIYTLLMCGVALVGTN